MIHSVLFGMFHLRNITKIQPFPDPEFPEEIIYPHVDTDSVPFWALGVSVSHVSIPKDAFSSAWVQHKSFNLQGLRNETYVSTYQSSLRSNDFISKLCHVESDICCILDTGCTKPMVSKWALDRMGPKEPKA